MDKSIDYIAEKLSPFGARSLEYEGVKFIGIKNPYSDNNMAFTFDDDKFTMEFTYQASRFEYGDEDYAVKIAREFLSDKLCAVEIFLSGKAIFGGTRETAGANFRSAEEFALWYSAGNTEVAEKLKRFLANDGATVKCFSWSGKYDRVARFENGSAKEV